MITYARLQNFRSYSDGSFEFNPSVNIVVGSNASGKTSLLEAVVIGLVGKSFKARDSELLRHETAWSRIDIGVDNGLERIVKIKEASGVFEKTFDVDGTVYKRLPSAKTVPLVLFEPNHLLLFHGSPEMRRVFLDELLSMVVNGYSTTLRHYKRVLAQRNALLKQHKSPTKEQLFVWNLRLSELGGSIASERHAILEVFNQKISELYSSIAGHKTTISLEYKSNNTISNYETSFLQKLEQNIEKDRERGFTTSGPHRDDFGVLIDGSDTSEVASRGEIRTLVLVLKMLEAECIESARHQKPILLFDDVFSELDGHRRQALVDFLKPYQTFITTTDADVVLEHFTNKAHVIALG